MAVNLGEAATFGVMASATTVIVVHWNRPNRCEKAVRAVRDSAVATEVVVVDNGSRPEHLEHLRAVVPADVRIIENGSNLGFGPAANVGFRWWLAERAGEWVALMPHDALPAPDCLSEMLAAVAARPRAGLACADFGDGATPVVDPYFGGILGPQTVDEGWEPAGHPHGTFMLARRACLEQVGLFDERYFSYCEEADLALRAAEFGWDSGLVRGAMVVNPDIGSRSAAVDYLQLRNTLLQVREHSGRYKAFIRFCIALIHLADGVVRPSSRGPYWDPQARVRALVDHLRRRYGPPPPDLLAR
jgi:GT2 family glycosyltransferase